MRYTRYNYKRKNKGSFFLWFVLFLLLSIAIGIVVFKMFFSEGKIGNPLDFFKDNNQNIYEEEVTSKDFMLLQCGLFSTEDNAKSAASSLPSGINGFVVQDGEKFKVISGIYTEDVAKSKSEVLTSAGTNNFTIRCSLKVDSSEKNIIIQILDGYVQIMDKLDESGVKGINTTDFKSWTLETVSNVSNPSEELVLLSENIKELPEEYTKNNLEGSKKFLYNFLIKYRV